MKKFKCIIEQPMQFIINVKGKNYTEAVMNLESKINKDFKNKEVSTKGLITNYKVKEVKEL